MATVKVTLAEHRQMLLANPDRYILDRERACENWTRHGYSFFRKEIKTNKAKSKLRGLLRTMADLVFDAQCCRPLFEIEDKAYAWNSPKNFSDNYIRYEVGHLNPRNAGGLSLPENLCFQSARCNQHIQSALPIDEVLFLIGHHDEIAERLSSLNKLHASNRWVELKNEISLLKGQ